MKNFLNVFKPVFRDTAHQIRYTTKTYVAARGYATTPQAFKWDDPLDFQSQLTEDEIAISRTAEDYCQEQLLPRVLRKSFHRKLLSLH